MSTTKKSIIAASSELIFIFSPSTYYYYSITQKGSRIDYPGKENALLVYQSLKLQEWDKVTFIKGDEWIAGNLSYHLSHYLNQRPKWVYSSKGNYMCGKWDSMANKSNHLGLFSLFLKTGANEEGCFEYERKVEIIND